MMKENHFVADERFLVAATLQNCQKAALCNSCFYQHKHHWVIISV